MRVWSKPLLGLALLTALLVGAAPIAGCGPEADQVELRLFPCVFAGVEPRAVVIELTGFDADGQLVETFEAGFDDIATTVFADGYATVGYRKDPRVVRAQVRLGWFSTPTAGSLAEAEAVIVYEQLEVPGLGEVLDLRTNVGDCAEIGGDGDGDPSGDGDGDPSGDGDGDPSGDGDGDPSGDGDGDPSGDGDGDPSGDGDGDPSGDGDGDPEEVPEVGDSCPNVSTFYCSPRPDGEAGVPLLCSQTTMQLTMASNLWLTVGCAADFCPEGSSNPVDGCAGFGQPANCLCELDNAEACAGATLGCTGDGFIRLCYAGTVVTGECNNCQMTPGGYYSCTR
jgi:hypothetical protein